MRQRFCGMVVLAGFILSWPALAADEKKKAGDGSANPNLIDADKLSPGSFAGKLLSAPSPGGSFTLEVPYAYAVPTGAAPQRPAVNAAALNNLSRLQQQAAQLQQQVARARRPKDAAQAMQQLNGTMAQMQQAMAQAQAGQAVPQPLPFKIVTDKKVVEFHAASEMIVRSLVLPAEYDDKGKLKQRTPEEIKKLKGDNPQLPGFESRIEDVQAGMTVVVVMGRAIPRKEGDKDKEAGDKDKKHPNEVTVVLIANTDTGENSMSATSPRKGKK